MAEDLAVLRRLLAAWRASRDPALEPWIDKAGIRVARARGSIAGSKTEPELRWQELAKAKDAGDVDRLLDATWNISRSAVLARIVALAGFPPDPRIARRLHPGLQTFDAWLAKNKGRIPLQ